ncbi:MAG: periplasmic heavy metal sensor [Bacteroidales bacterium]|nr:periplasmic heavy metal sensor [Bacteroidales bacterium]
MISTKQKRTIALLVIVITLVNLGALASVLYKLRQVEKFHEAGLVEHMDENPSNDPASVFMMREIGFDKTQQRLMNASKLNLRREVSPMLAELRQLNADLIDEVMQPVPDTIRLDAICAEIGSLHTLMKIETTHHLLDIKQIASPEQDEKLKDFYREMLNRGDEPRPDGMGRRHRRGWRNRRRQ